MGKNNLRIEFNFRMKAEKHPGFRLLRKECFAAWQCARSGDVTGKATCNATEGARAEPPEGAAESVPRFLRLDLCLDPSLCF